MFVFVYVLLRYHLMYAFTEHCQPVMCAQLYALVTLPEWAKVRKMSRNLIWSGKVKESKHSFFKKVKKKSFFFYLNRLSDRTWKPWNLTVSKTICQKSRSNSLRCTPFVGKHLDFWPCYFQSFFMEFFRNSLVCVCA